MFCAFAMVQVRVLKSIRMRNDDELSNENIRRRQCLIFLFFYPINKGCAHSKNSSNAASGHNFTESFDANKYVCSTTCNVYTSRLQETTTAFNDRGIGKRHFLVAHSPRLTIMALIHYSHFHWAYRRLRRYLGEHWKLKKTWWTLNPFSQLFPSIMTIERWIELELNCYSRFYR